MCTRYLETLVLSIYIPPIFSFPCLLALAGPPALGLAAVAASTLCTARDPRAVAGAGRGRRCRLRCRGGAAATLGRLAGLAPVATPGAGARRAEGAGDAVDADVVGRLSLLVAVVLGNCGGYRRRFRSRSGRGRGRWHRGGRYRGRPSSDGVVIPGNGDPDVVDLPGIIIISISDGLVAVVEFRVGKHLDPRTSSPGVAIALSGGAAVGHDGTEVGLRIAPAIVVGGRGTAARGATVVIAAEVVTNLCDNESKTMKEGSRSDIFVWKEIDPCLFLDDSPQTK